MHTSATTNRSAASKEQYYTPRAATLALIERVKLTGPFLEPCAGELHIANVLKSIAPVITNDLYTTGCNFQLDATLLDSWLAFGRFTWAVTNPPFNQAPKILPPAYKLATNGVAFLLRLSYLEPCKNRAAWLERYPPSQIIVLPRISFTGDGKTDSVTCAWLIWRKPLLTHDIYKPIDIVNPF